MDTTELELVEWAREECASNAELRNRGQPHKQSFIRAENLEEYRGRRALTGSAGYQPKTLFGLAAGLSVAQIHAANERKERELAIREFQAKERAQLERQRLNLEEQRLAIEIAREQRAREKHKPRRSPPRPPKAKVVDF